MSLGKAVFLSTPRAAANSGQNAWVQCPRSSGVSEEAWGGLSLPPACSTLPSKTKAGSFPILSGTSPGSAWPTPTTHPQGGAAGGYALQHPKDALHPPPGSRASSLTFGMRFSSFPGSQQLLVWTQRVCRSRPLAGHPFDFGLPGGGEPLGKEQKPLVVWVTSPWRSRKSLCPLPWGTMCPWGG